MKIKITLLYFSLFFAQHVDAQDIFKQLSKQFALFRSERKYDSALNVARQLNVWTLQNETDTSLNYAVSLRYIGVSFYESEKLDSAKKYFTYSLSVLKNQNRVEHVDYAKSLFNLGLLSNDIMDHKAALKYSKQAMDIRKNVLGEENTDYLLSLNNVGASYHYMGIYDSAEAYYKRAMEIRKKVLGEEHPDYLQSLNNLGVLYKNMGDFISAEDYHKEAIRIKKKVLGEQHPDYASSLNNIALLYSNMGYYKEAENYNHEALEIRKKVLGEQHPDYAGSLNNIALLYREMGDYDLAEKYFLQVVDYLKRQPREKDRLQTSLKVATLNNLGILYIDIGDYKSAENYLSQAMEIRKELLGELHPDFASSILNLGNVSLKKGDYDSAEKYFKHALEIRKKILGDKHYECANVLKNMGALSEIRGNNKSAKTYYNQALDIIKITYGENHIEYAMCLYNLGNQSNNTGDYKSAETYYNRAFDIIKKIVGEDHPKYLKIQNSFAYLFTKTNREKEAYNKLNNSYLINLKVIANNFEWLNDTQKEAFWKKESDFYDVISWYADQVSEKLPESVGLNYNSILVTKSKLLEAKITSENYYQEVDELRAEVGYRRRLLAKMESEGSTDKGKIDEIQHEADSLDKRLTLSWPEYAQQKRNLTITWDQVQENLDDNEAAIEFVRVKNEDNTIAYYNALVLKKGDKNPTLVKLCKESELLEILPNKGFSAYYPLIWKPMEVLLKEVKVIYYAPTGELNNIPFSAIYSDNKKEAEIIDSKKDNHGIVTPQENVTYLMDLYTLHQLTSTRYLAMGIKQKAKETIGKKVALAGGINYDFLPGSNAVFNTNETNNRTKRSSDLNSGKLNYLEGTKAEVEKINQLLTAAFWETKVLENNDATEENITRLEGKEAKDILHLATHGFAFSEMDSKDNTINKNSLRYNYRFSSNPMVRSGLLLTGGNWAWIGSDTLSKLGAEQNGILTAIEVSQLNLKKTKLVVLSACETGLGKIEGAEGTFGLKRGFKLAGVEQLIVSLWPVPDKETTELMTLFYTNLIETNLPISAFERAQKVMRNKYPEEPIKWAGFVLVR